MKFVDREKYVEKANKTFEKVKEAVLKIIPNAQVEHIGSSSIKGAISKGDLDIYVGVSQEYFDQAIPLIKRLGFNEKKDTLRTTSLCMFEIDDYEIDTAIQLVAKGSEFESFLYFRDALNNSSHLVSKYNQLKKSCIGMSEDDYRYKKSKFIESVLDKK